MRRPLVLALATLLLAPAAGSQAPTRPDARRALLMAERAAAEESARRGAVAALRTVGDTSLVVLWEAAPVAAGKPAALALLEAQPALRGARVQWQAMHAEISRDSTVGVTWGVVTLAASDTAPLRFGRYLAGWRRGADGAWRLRALAWIGIARPNTTVLPAGLALGALADGVPAHARGPADADRAFAARALATDAPTAFAEFAAPDAVAFAGTGELTFGPEAIRAGFAPGRSRWVWGPVLADAAGSDDLGWTVGEAEITPEGASAPFRSKYLSLWRRTPAGWRYLADGGNSR